MTAVGEGGPRKQTKNHLPMLWLLMKLLFDDKMTSGNIKARKWENSKTGDGFQIIFYHLNRFNIIFEFAILNNIWWIRWFESNLSTVHFFPYNIFNFIIL